MPDGLDDYLDPPKPQPFKTKRGALKFQPESDWSLSRLADVESEYQKTTGQRLPVNVRGQGNIHNKWNYDHADSADIGINPNSKEGQTLITQLQRQNVPFLAFDRAIPGVATGPHVHIGRPSKRRGAQVQQKPTGLDSYLDPAPLDNYIDPPQRNPFTPPTKSPFAGVQAGASGSRQQQPPLTGTEDLLNTIGGREKRGEDIQNILENVTGAVAGTGRQLANAQELGMRVTPIGIAGRELSKRVTGFDPQAIPSKIKDASEYLESAVAENEAARPAPTTFAGNVRRGVGKGVGAAVVELPKLLLGGIVLKAANLPVQGALSRADEGVSGIVKGAAGGLVYHYGGALTGKAFSGVSPYLAKMGNSLVWIAGPVAEHQLVAKATGSEPPNLAQSIGENIPFGIMAGMGAKGKKPQPVQVKEGNTVRDATEADLPKIVSRELEVVPPAVEAAERRSIQREFDKIKETEVPQRFYHTQYGNVVKAADQTGARKGKTKIYVEGNPEEIHYPKTVDLRGRGNERMVPIKDSASQPVEVLPEKPQQPSETQGALPATPPSPETLRARTPTLAERAEQMRAERERGDLSAFERSALEQELRALKAEDVELRQRAQADEQRLAEGGVRGAGGIAKPLSEVLAERRDQIAARLTEVESALSAKSSSPETLRVEPELKGQSLIDYLIKTDDAAERYRNDPTERAEFEADLRPELENATATLQRIPLKNLKLNDGHIDKETVEHYSTLKSTPPPIVVEDGRVYEGNHRVVVARSKGETEISAYVISRTKPTTSVEQGAFAERPRNEIGLNETQQVEWDRVTKNPADYGGVEGIRQILNKSRLSQAQKDALLSRVEQGVELKTIKGDAAKTAQLSATESERQSVESAPALTENQIKVAEYDRQHEVKQRKEALLAKGRADRNVASTKKFFRDVEAQFKPEEIKGYPKSGLVELIDGRLMAHSGDTAKFYDVSPEKPSEQKPIKEVIPSEATAQKVSESTPSKVDVFDEGAGLGGTPKGEPPAPSKPELPKVKEAFRLPFIDPAERGNQARLKQSINLEYATESGRQIKKAVTIGKRQKQLENKHSVIGKLLDCLHA